MEKEELLINELSELIGVELNLSADKICDLVVDERIVVLRYRPDDDSWLYFGVVHEESDDFSGRILKKALELNLFGIETHGFHLGLFGNALVLSGSVNMDGLTAEYFAEKILALSRHIGELAEKLNANSVESCVAEEVSDPWNTGFMQV